MSSKSWQAWPATATPKETDWHFQPVFFLLHEYLKDRDALQKMYGHISIVIGIKKHQYVPKDSWQVNRRIHIYICIMYIYICITYIYTYHIIPICIYIYIYIHISDLHPDQPVKHFDSRSSSGSGSYVPCGLWMLCRRWRFSSCGGEEDCWKPEDFELQFFQ